MLNLHFLFVFFFKHKYLVYNLHLIIARVDANIHSSMTLTELVVSSPDINCLKISFSCAQYIFSGSFWRLDKTTRLEIFLKLKRSGWRPLTHIIGMGSKGVIDIPIVFANILTWTAAKCFVLMSEQLYTLVLIECCIHMWPILLSIQISDLLCMADSSAIAQSLNLLLKSVSRSMSGITCCHGDKLWAPLSEMLITPWILVNLCPSTWCQLQWGENRCI